MGMVILEAIGSDGERLALRAGEVTDTPVGWDSDLSSATYDADGMDDAELEAVIFDALTGLDPEWRSHLRVAE